MQPQSEQLAIKDSYLTIVAITVVAYLSADVVHHVMGHGLACLASGGQIKLLSSVFVNCSLTGSMIDLAGPLANFVLGALAFLLVHFLPRLSSLMRLFLVLVAIFNLLWFCGQLIFSVAAMTDDWAWPMKQFNVSAFSRYALIAVGIVGYSITNRIAARHIACFSHPINRAKRIMIIAWISAGIIACITVVFDRHAMAVMWRNAIPQSLLASIGLLFLPAKAARLPFTESVALLAFSPIWIAIAVLASAVSILLLGPGVTLTR